LRSGVGHVIGCGGGVGGCCGCWLWLDMGWMWLWLQLINVVAMGADCLVCLGDAAWPKQPWVLHSLFSLIICGHMAEWLSVLCVIPQGLRFKLGWIHLFFSNNNIN